jgi:hypothetical protein
LFNNIPADTPKSRRQTKLRVMAHPNKIYSPQNYDIFRMLLKFCIKKSSMIQKKKNTSSLASFKHPFEKIKKTKNVTFVTP